MIRLWTKNTSQGTHITRLTNTNLYRCTIRQDDCRQDEIILCDLNVYQSALYVLQYLVGTTVGVSVGSLVGVALGDSDGVDDGADVGLEVGMVDGADDGELIMSFHFVSYQYVAYHISIIWHNSN